MRNQIKQSKILFVDDESINCINFKLNFDNIYDIYTASSGQEALTIFHQHDDIGIVISDQRMPGMTGVEFLIQIYKLDPDTIRIIITGYTEVRDILDAVNNGHIYQYITKPWNYSELRTILERSVDSWRLHNDNKSLLLEKQEVNMELSEKNRQLQRLTSDLFQVQEEELNRIAMELQDGLGQPLSAIKFQLESLESFLKNDDCKTTDNIFESLDILREYIEKITNTTRTLTQDLGSVGVHSLGIDSAVEELIYRFALDTNLTNKCSLKKIAHLLSNQEQCHLYRILQELLNNICKHAFATFFSIVIDIKGETIVVRVADDGVGLSRVDGEKKSHYVQGRGINILLERVAALKGELSFSSASGKGTEVVIHIRRPFSTSKC